jgi:hypothetical protein
MATARTAATGATGQGASFVREIEQMEKALGKRMCRGLLTAVARAWNPKDIREPEVQQKVQVHMQAAELGLRRLDVGLDKTGPELLTQVLRSLKLQSLTQVDNLQTLHQILLALEAVAQEREVNSSAWQEYSFVFLSFGRLPKRAGEPVRAPAILLVEAASASL